MRRRADGGACRRAGLVPLALVLTLGVCVLSACKVPDLSGFVGSATSVQGAMAQAGAEYRPIVEEFGEEDSLEQFDADWMKVRGATDALVEYAQSLNAIAAAGKNGSEGAKALAESVDRLVGRVGNVGIAASEITNVVTDLYGIGAQAIAAKKLSDATGQAHPYVDAICRILADDVIANLGDDLDLVQEAAEDDINDEFADVSRDYALMRKQRQELTVELAQDDPDSWPQETIDQIANIDAAMAGMQPRWDEYQAALKQSRRLREEQKRLFAQLGVALQALSEEHASLKATIESNSTFSLSNVQNAADEILVIVNRIREIRDDG